MATSPIARPWHVRHFLAACAVVATVLAAMIIAAGAAPVLAIDERPCEPHLVTHSPEGSQGDERAVSITAQSIERGVDGWLTVAWEAAPGTTVTAVKVTQTDGSVATITEDTSVGSAFDVLELRFCGTTDETGAPPEEPAGDGPDQDEPMDTDGSSGSEGDDGDEVNDPDPDGAPDDGEADEGTPENEDEAASETEVLGVQLTGDGDSGTGSSLLAVLAVLLGLGAVAGGGVVWYRRTSA